MNSGTPVAIKGKIVDDKTRCTHYHSPLDIIALKFRCCNSYYPCFFCHEEEAGHPAQRWSREERDQKAVFCGVCKTELTIREYLASNYSCPSCAAAFNPGCRHHNHLYFEE